MAASRRAQTAPLSCVPQPASRCARPGRAETFSWAKVVVMPLGMVADRLMGRVVPTSSPLSWLERPRVTSCPPGPTSGGCGPRPRTAPCRPDRREAPTTRRSSFHQACRMLARRFGLGLRRVDQALWVGVSGPSRCGSITDTRSTRQKRMRREAGEIRHWRGSGRAPIMGTWTSSTQLGVR